jgi:GAF domain-containing protein
MPSSEADIARAYKELALLVLDEHPLGAVLRRIAELAARIVPGAQDASVTLVQGGKARSVAFSGQVAVTLDERQYELGYGPCMDAARTGQVISIEDTSHSEAYSEFSRQAHRQGIHRILSIGMPGLQDTGGALNIYCTAAPGRFDQATREIATTFAGYAAFVLQNAAIYARALEEVGQMTQAMASRASIEQAKGIIMRDQQITADEAFTFLVQAASRSDRKVRDVAQRLIDTASTTTTAATPPAGP